MNKTDTTQKAIEEYKNGYSIAFVSEKYDIPKTSLNRHLRKAGVIRRYTKRKKVIPDLIGKKFGKLKVVELVMEGEGRIVWMCQCECGVKQKVRQTHLLSGKEMCGNCQMTGSRSPVWKGHEKLSGTRWKYIKNGAIRKSRVLEFDITIDYAWNLYEKQNGKCNLSGLSIPFSENSSEYGVASLDRIDSSKGYIEGNVQWVHQDVNKMKFDLSQSRLIELCHLICKINGE